MTTYPGGKNGAGIYQRLINLIPPHVEYIAPFAGFDAIARHKRPAETTVLVDLDTDALKNLLAALKSAPGDGLLSAGRDNVELIEGCGIEWLHGAFSLDRYFPIRPLKRDSAAEYGGSDRRPGTAAVKRDARSDRQKEWDSVFVYCDPPYPLSVRSGERVIYKHEMSDADHVRLLETITSLPCPCMVSCYPNRLYNEALVDWHRIEYLAPTRGASKIECAWINYPPPTRLHDSRYLGNDKREREKIRRRVRNWTNGLKRLPSLERQAIVDAIVETR